MVLEKVYCFEGANGVGKSTTIEKIKNILEHQNKKVLVLREPGGNPFSEYTLRVFLKDTENYNPAYPYVNHLGRLMLFLGSRAFNAQMILNKYEYYDYIILDRFTASTLSYNVMQLKQMGDVLNIGDIYNLEKACRQNIIPNCTFYLNEPPEEIAKRKMRAEGHGISKLESFIEYADKTQKHYRSAIAYLELVEKWKFKTISGENYTQQILHIIGHKRELDYD